MLRSVTINLASDVYRYKMAYHGDEFLHNGAVTIVNNTDHALHYAIEEELQSRTFLINSAVDFKGLIRKQKEKNVLYIVRCLRFVRS